ncbi:hypothetical protein C0995_012578 [Termitomyces sp. Mi166|nr:hypothetical protein C0995_012578 [Termitomyces sp. Mi166\
MILYDDLDEKEKAQALSELPPASKVLLAQEETLEGKGKEKKKASAVTDKEEEKVEEKEFTLLMEVVARLSFLNLG